MVGWNCPNSCDKGRTSQEGFSSLNIYHIFVGERVCVSPFLWNLLAHTHYFGRLFFTLCKIECWQYVKMLDYKDSLIVINFLGLSKRGIFNMVWLYGWCIGMGQYKYLVQYYSLLGWVWFICLWWSKENAAVFNFLSFFFFLW